MQGAGQFGWLGWSLASVKTCQAIKIDGNHVQKTVTKTVIFCFQIAFIPLIFVVFHFTLYLVTKARLN